MFAGVQNAEQRVYLPTLKPSITTSSLRHGRAVYTGRKVVDTAIVTIEEVITAKGKRAYLAIARDGKRATIEDLKAIRTQIEKELARHGLVKDRAAHDKAKYEANKEAVKARMRAYYHAVGKQKRDARKDLINQQRRERYALKVATKKAMANMSTTTE